MKYRILFILALVCFLPAMISAQVAVTGKITGIVSDPSGGAVANATVTVKSTALMSPRTIATSTDGAYLFDLLPPGTYEVTVTAAGFRTVNQTGVVLTAGFTATVNPMLQVGEVTQTVQVQGETVVDLQNVQTSTTFDQTLLQDIPSGRDPWSTVPRCQASPPALSMWQATIAISNLLCKYTEVLKRSRSTAITDWT